MDCGDRRFISIAGELDRSGISTIWLILWAEVQNFYGDIKKTETQNQFLRRLQNEMYLSKQIPSPVVTDKPGFDGAAVVALHGITFSTKEEMHQAIYNVATAIINEVIPRDKTIAELQQSVLASERLRMCDAASAISETNALRHRVKELEKEILKGNTIA